MSDHPNRSVNDDLDPGEQKLGAIYARALLGAAEKSGQAADMLAELDSFVHDVLDRKPEFETILGSAMISAEQKEEIIDRTIGSVGSPLLVNVFKVLARHGRLGSIRAIARVAQDIYNELQGKVRVEVVTAAPLDHETSSQVADRLRGMLGREPVLASRTDPALIGGIILRVGDTVYDGSIATQLHRLTGQIVSRSIHEIQSRRDRFSYPAGN